MKYMKKAGGKPKNKNGLIAFFCFMYFMSSCFPVKIGLILAGVMQNHGQASRHVWR